MKKLLLAASTVLTAIVLTVGNAHACGLLDFGCNAAKQKAEKTQAVISIIDAGRKAGWKMSARNSLTARSPKCAALASTRRNAGLSTRSRV